MNVCKTNHTFRSCTRPLLALLVLLLFSVKAVAQEPLRGTDSRVRVVTSIDPASILVGEQSVLTIKVYTPKGAKVNINLPENALLNGVEVLSAPVLKDSSMISDDIAERIYTVPVTAFDSATYEVKPVDVLVDNQVYSQEEAPLLQATNIPVDVSKPDQFFGIKENWKVPFVWKDYLWILYLLASSLLFIAAVVLLVIYIARKRKTAVALPPDIPVTDPYTEAKSTLEELRKAELWRQGSVKEHYTILSDTIRRYLERTLGLSTMDKTSAEIVEQMSLRKEVKHEHVGELRALLSEADLVKFAKYKPSESENIGSVNASNKFIDDLHEEHKAYIEELARAEKEDMSKTENRSES
ncbi:hypothetical protein [Porphyromonas sp. COT-108 OH1349]|uniref:hypothetical protein n=1 Tax=Porphyromonas sp. COT-108 OH1349 TaxID=1537504 RepID=UPI00052CB184|nr:hypothetical protein [Porphyromonas sp. COT-108 OH1349]KGN70533.1 hypothetical protein JT26_03475 [Porphyromonas sp. COT-108 OH1349]